MNAYIDDADFRLYVGDVRAVLRELPDASVDCCVTSPPYWGLRDYGTEGQIGLEASPEEFVGEMVAVFREVRRVLAPHGTLWLNLGDSYNNYDGGSYANDAREPGQQHGSFHLSRRSREVAESREPRPLTGGLKRKDLVGIPWRVAFALQADGWYLRADIIWAKPNPMPESVTDRPTKAHEYVFLLTKQPRYFFDQEVVREPETGLPQRRLSSGVSLERAAAAKPSGGRLSGALDQRGRVYGNGRNVRSVWEIATQPYPAAHFATFPEALPERCIKAGTPLSVCVTCGEPRVRIVERESVNPWQERKEAGASAGSRARGYNENHGEGMSHTLGVNTRSVGFTDCGHGNYRTGVVLDPFMGSGTTALVARRLGRRSIGVELNPEYAELAARRLQQLSLLAEEAV